MNFEELIASLKDKLDQEYKKNKNEIDDLNDKLQDAKNEKEKFRKWHSIGTFIALLAGIVPLVLGGYSLWKSYKIAELNHFVHSLVNLPSVLMIFSGIGCLALTIPATSFVFEKMEKIVNYVYSTILGKDIKKIEKTIDKCSKLYSEHKEYGEHLSSLYKKFNNYKDVYDYILTSAEKNKTFTDNDVQQLFRLLNIYKLSTLIYLLYQDKLDAFEKEDLRNRVSIEREIDIDGKILEIKKIYQENAINNSNTKSNYVRRRRVDYFHHDTDEELEESSGKSK